MQLLEGSRLITSDWTPPITAGYLGAF